MSQQSRGRKSKYDSHVKPKLAEIENWREKGFSEEWIAAKLGVAYSSLSLYKLKYSELSEVLSKSKEKIGIKLKKALWREAEGYEYTEVHEDAELEPYYDEFGKLQHRVIKIRRKKIKKKCRPQQSLLIFALCNILPDEFKRIDKDVLDNLGEELEKRIFSSDKIKEAFKVLYPDDKGKK